MSLLEITEIELIKLLTTEDDNPYFRHKGVFNEGIYFEDVEIVSRSKQGIILLMSVEISNYKIFFKNVHFKSEILISGIKFLEYVRFNKCTFEQPFFIGSIIDASNVNNSVHPSYFNYLHFSECVFMKKLTIDKAVFEDFYTERCIFNSDENNFLSPKECIYIQNGDFNKGLAILGGKINGSIVVNGGDFKNSLHFGQNLEVEDSIVIRKGIFTSISLNDVLVNKFLVISAHHNFIPVIVIGVGVKKIEFSPIHSYKNGEPKRLIIKSLIFQYSPENGFIKNNCLIKQCIFDTYNSNNTSTLSFYEPEIEVLKFNHFNNYAKINFVGLKPRKNEGEIIFNSSNVGNVDFISCDLESYDIFVDSSKISNISYTSTKFPISFKSKKEGVALKKQLIETYDQLQAVASKQGDKVNNLRWQHLSYKNYMLSITPFERKWWLLKLLHISNNFKTSSFRGFCFTTLTSIIIFYYFIIAYFNTDMNLFEIMHNYSKYYFEFINPTHRYNFIEEKGSQSPELTAFLDILGRIVIGFGIYQTIQAFRRYGKSD